MYNREKSKNDLIHELNWDLDKVDKLEKRLATFQENADNDTHFPWELFHNASLAYQSLDEMGHLLDVNDVWLALLGYERSQVVGRRISDFLTTESRASLFEENLVYLDKNKLNNTEVALVAKNGFIIRCLMNSQVNPNDEEKIYPIHSILKDVTESKRMETDLQENKNRYKLMIDNADDLVWVHDINGKYRFVSPSVESIFGYTPEETLDLSYTDHMPEEEIQIVKNYLAEIFSESDGSEQKKKAYRLELRQIRKDGSLFWTEVVTSPLRDESGEIVAFQGVTRDITQRKEMEQDLRTKECFLSAVLESVQDGINIIDSEMTIYRVNEVMRRWSGWSGPLEGRKCYEVYHGASQPCSQCSALRCLQSGKTEYEEWRGHYHSDAEWVEVASHPMRHPCSGELEYVVEFVRDVTQRKRAEKALRESERHFRELFEQAAIGIILSDSEHNILMVNRKACAILGYSREELLRMGAGDVIHPDDLRENPLRENMKTLNSNGTVEIERRFRKKDGSSIHVLVNMGKLACEGGQEPYMVMFQDISERKRMEDRLLEMSLCEPLTGVYNRAFFEEQMRRLEKEAPCPVGLLACDINGLKLINDTMGHDEGDELVKAVARILKRCFRKSDLIARVGGDEFAVILPGSGKEDLQACCDRIRSEVAQHNATARKYNLSLSIGYALEEESPVDMQELFKRADNAMFKEKLQQSYSSKSEIVQALIKTLEARDQITEGHAGRLFNYAQQLGRSLGLSEERLNDLQLLARFHDLGKVGISDRILFKNGELSEEEFQEMKWHCEIGHRIALSTSDLAPIAEYILKHHEWWDGRGYPQGLSGEEIPLECRILAIADAYDAMTSERPYGDVMTHNEAMRELRRYAGTQFDPYLVQRFISLGQNWRKN